MNQTNLFQLIFILTFFVRSNLLQDVQEHVQEHVQEDIPEDVHEHVQEDVRVTNLKTSRLTINKLVNYGRKIRMQQTSRKTRKMTKVPKSRVMLWKGNPSAQPLTDGFTDDAWYRDRLNHTDGLKIMYGPDKGKPITVSKCGIPSVNARIVGGFRAKLGQFPWAVLLYYRDKPFCGGVILNEKWILTAAHCLNAFENEKGIQIKAGMIGMGEGLTYDIIKFIRHEKYDMDTMLYDIALLRTNQSIDGQREAFVQTINGVCLPEPFAEPRGSTVTIGGWGRTSQNDDPSRYLNLVTLDIMDLKECQRIFGTPMIGFPNGYSVNNSQLCTYTPNKDACQGDSGGGAIEKIDGKAFLVGVVSFGVGCATEYPGILTKVSHNLDWIARNVD